MAFALKGQGATEYLVLLAVVLIIALVSIALLGFFPGLATDAKITQSNSYWRGEALPFSIEEHAITTDGAVTLVMMNKESSGILRVSNITFGNAVPSGLPIAFAPGETRTVSLVNYSDGTGMTAGTVYDASITITYNTSNGVVNTQYGAKSVVGKYS
jgi:hypothetical protein